METNMPEDLDKKNSQKAMKLWPRLGLMKPELSEQRNAQKTEEHRLPSKKIRFLQDGLVLYFLAGLLLSLLFNSGAMEREYELGTAPRA